MHGAVVARLCLLAVETPHGGFVPPLHDTTCLFEDGHKRASLEITMLHEQLIGLQREVLMEKRDSEATSLPKSANHFGKGVEAILIRRIQFGNFVDVGRSFQVIGCTVRPSFPGNAVHSSRHAESACYRL